MNYREKGKVVADGLYSVYFQLQFLQFYPCCTAEKRSSFLLACIIITIIIITDSSWYQKKNKRAMGTLETSREDIKFITKSKRKEPWAPWGRAGRISNLFLDRGVHCTIKFFQSICGYWALG